MTAERRAIEHPLFLDYSSAPVPPLKFVLQRAYAPVGDVERPTPGITFQHSPWYTEVGVELTGIDAVAVLYILTTGEENVLLAACIEETFEPFFQLLSGDDFGDGVTALTQRQWPDVHAMLVRSNAPPSAVEGRVLCTVITPGRLQWAVADTYRRSELDHITSDQLLDLIGTSVQTCLRATNVGIELPGLVEVLGGPDRLSRRLKGAAGLLGATSQIGGVLGGGIGGDELLELGKSVREAFSSARKLRD